MSVVVPVSPLFTRMVGSLEGGAPVFNQIQVYLVSEHF